MDNGKPSLEQTVTLWTDHYFKRTRALVNFHGDVTVTYAVFMRRPVLFAPKLALDFLYAILQDRNQKAKIELLHEEGAVVGSGQPLMYITGSLSALVDLETLLLQKLGPACVAAYNAYSMCSELPKIAFLAMDVRHCAGLEMDDMMAYAACVGSERARKSHQATGFIGNATDATAHYFHQKQGLGTMPHAFIGYAGSTVRAAELYHELYPDESMTVLVDYFGKEISDSLAVCQRFPTLAKSGALMLRIDTPGGRYIEGLDSYKSYELLASLAPEAIRGYRSESELAYLVGHGTSAAAIHALRATLDAQGFEKVKIVASSGFSPAKCRMMAVAKAPIDVIGSGSYLPTKWSETYATADIIEYDGEPRVKLGREFLFRSKEK